MRTGEAGGVDSVVDSGHAAGNWGGLSKAPQLELTQPVRLDGAQFPGSGAGAGKGGGPGGLWRRWGGGGPEKGWQDRGQCPAL